MPPWGLVWEMEDSSGWKRIEGDFGKFWLIMEIPPPQYPSFPFISLIPKQALSVRAPPRRPLPQSPRRACRHHALPSHALATHANKPRAPAPVMRSPRISMPTDMRMSHAVCTVLSPTPCLRLIRFSLARSSQLGRSWDQETHGAGCFVN
jgi:hypothetical protein